MREQEIARHVQETRDVRNGDRCEIIVKKKNFNQIIKCHDFHMYTILTIN